jgi:hypothetical protein
MKPNIRGRFIVFIAISLLNIPGIVPSLTKDSFSSATDSSPAIARVVIRTRQHLAAGVSAGRRVGPYDWDMTLNTYDFPKSHPQPIRFLFK